MSRDEASFAREAFRGLCALVSEGALVFEDRGELVCIEVSANALRILGLAPSDLLEQTRGAIVKRLEARGEPAASSLAALPAIAHDAVLVRLGSEDADACWWSSRAISVRGEVLGRIDVLRPADLVGELQKKLDEASQRLRDLSTVDELTGLANEKHLAHELDREHRRAQRTWQPYAVARIGADEVDALTAALGRAAFDALLRKVGEALRSGRREYDLVARADGSHDLLVLLPGLGESDVGPVLERSLSAMRDAARAGAGQDVTFCAGVALWVPPSMDRPEDMMQRAGTALEAARLMGRGNVEIDARQSEWKELPSEG